MMIFVCVKTVVRVSIEKYENVNDAHIDNNHGIFTFIILKLLR